MSAPDPTAGEREWEPCSVFGSHPRGGHNDAVLAAQHTPATPGAGDASEARSVDGKLDHGWCGCGKCYGTKPIAEAVRGWLRRRYREEWKP